MTDTLLDFSRTDELRLHGQVTAEIQPAAQALGMELLVAGAFARDLHLLHRFGIDTRRRTEDIDFALMVPDWYAFAELRHRLTRSGAFREDGKTQHRLRHACGLPVDLVPYGGVETSARTIQWPPSGDMVMEVFGFREAMASADVVALPGVDRCSVVSLSALALLKLVCWQDRHYREPKKDAHDLHLILENYLAAGNEPRLWDEFCAWTQEDDFSYELAGARMLGHDVRQLLTPESTGRVSKVLEEQSSTGYPGRLPLEMRPHAPDSARGLLLGMLRGLAGW